MSLTEHLRELRNRLAKALVALTIATVVCFIFEPHIFNILKEPYCSLPESARAGGGKCQLFFFGILDAFMIRLKISLISGAVFSAPVWLYQLWSFITPGLHRHERRWSLTFVGFSLVLFGLGAYFAYLTLSKGLQLLLGFSGDGLVSLLDVNKYLSYVFAMLLIFGLSFELPLLVAMLNLAGVVSTAKLRSWRRAEIFLVFVFAAVVTPSQDPFTMIALGLPMCLLYEVALVIGWLNDRRRGRRGDTSPYAGLDDDETSPLDFGDLSPSAEGMSSGAGEPSIPQPSISSTAAPSIPADPVGSGVGAAGSGSTPTNAAHLDIT